MLNNSSGYNNTANGQQALLYNTTGSRNTALGANSLFSNQTGSGNVAIGSGSMKNSVNNSLNVAIGDSSLSTYNDGANVDYMVGIGYRSLYGNTAGYYNTAVGGLSMTKLTLGYQNVAFGTNSLCNSISGSNNTAVGYNSLTGVAAGSSFNTAIGYYSGYNYDATSSAFLGASSGPNASGYTNSTAVGSNSLVMASNQVRIGNWAVTSIGGYANWTNVSDGRFKRNIRENVPGLEFIGRLRPVTYTLDIKGIGDAVSPVTGIASADKRSMEPPRDEKAVSEKEAIHYSGFIAQEVEKAAMDIGYDFSGVDAPKNDKDLYGLRYSEFVVPLVKAVQELDKQNNSQQLTNENQQLIIETQQKTIENQQMQLDELRQMVLELKQNSK